MPSLSMTPGRKFSSTTSAPSTRSQNIARSASSLRSSRMPRLLRFHNMKGADSPSMKGGAPRIESPCGLSILMTSAPRSPSCMPQNGPDRWVVRSRTTKPSSAPAMVSPQHVPERPHRALPLIGPRRVEDQLALGDDQESRRAALARDLLPHRLELARPVALLVGLAQMGHIDLDPADLLELRRGEP